jgi:hypothetical protein
MRSRLHTEKDTLSALKVGSLLQECAGEAGLRPDAPIAQQRLAQNDLRAQCYWPAVTMAEKLLMALSHTPGCAVGGVLKVAATAIAIPLSKAMVGERIISGTPGTFNADTAPSSKLIV